jgi:hypothetical protein
VSVLAKFRCDQAAAFADRVEFRFSAVIDDERSNRQWSKFTPAGSLLLTVTNPDVRFRPGECYILRISLADAETEIGD